VRLKGRMGDYEGRMGEYEGRTEDIYIICAV